MFPFVAVIKVGCVSAPLKGIPSRVPTSGFRSSVLSNSMNRPPLSRTTAGRKEGGVKLLDIADQPLGYAAAKKRKKMQGKFYLNPDWFLWGPSARD